MSHKTDWNEQSDQLLQFLYNDLKIFDWNTISRDLNERLGVSTTPQDSQNRYLQLNGPVVRTEWTPEQQKQLYRLHNQNGNKWAVIAQKLLGRTDNCVKNHFYSKLRKSLRTLNKIAKLYLKKVVRQVNQGVLYKLTEATDEALKQQPQINRKTIEMCFELKNKLLCYETDQKDIKDNFNYQTEKSILLDLLEFNKNYKKKSKKQKQKLPVPENGKNMTLTKKTKKRKQRLRPLDESYQKSDDDYVSFTESKNSNRRSLLERQSDSNLIIPRKTINFLIKEPTPEDKEKYEKSSFQPKNGVEDILKAEGILQNGDYGSMNFFRRQSSNRSFSIHSESSQPEDMFGQDFEFNAGMKELSEMENDSQIFNRNNQ